MFVQVFWDDEKNANSDQLSESWIHNSVFWLFTLLLLHRQANKDCIHQLFKNNQNHTSASINVTSCKTTIIDSQNQDYYIKLNCY